MAGQGNPELLLDKRIFKKQSKQKVVIEKSKSKQIGAFAMNRSELIDAIAQKSGVSKKDIGDVISALTDTVGEALEKGEKVSLEGVNKTV